MKGQRLDERLVDEGLADNRTRARALIMSGVVLVDDVPVDKAGAAVKPESQIRLKGAVRRFVSRGGEKLEGALDDLAIDPSGLFCLDVGASTGGFTDCLLQKGARGVVALDVGTAQLHEQLRQDPRVHVHERTNARELCADHLPEPVDLVVVDVSFISIELLLEPIQRAAPGAELLLMVKPQFEVGRESVGKGGVVRDDALRDAAVDKIRDAAVALGYRERGRVDSRVHGPKGNREVFLHVYPSDRF
ncbi:MAG: TlyA family RNA methyltransferase [Myxococcota bacterium]|jgi:23S rRNA (cytidine1920-2'-O)/16S rRNA (cytidine1409-2'-O)-methyltransferase|nr:TlyA family RNA methyltransferase [Myxococcota bacterium]